MTDNRCYEEEVYADPDMIYPAGSVAHRNAQDYWRFKQARKRAALRAGQGRGRLKPTHQERR